MLKEQFYTESTCLPGANEDTECGMHLIDCFELIKLFSMLPECI